MKHLRVPRACLLWFFLASFLSASWAQQAGAGAGLAVEAPGQAASPQVISFSGLAAGQPDGDLEITFALYPDQPGAAALWTESQMVKVAQGKYTALLGSASPAGIPSEVFAASSAHWLGVRIHRSESDGVESRYLLVSVPYAMRAIEAESLGGLPSSQYVTTQQLQSILRSTTMVSGSGTQPVPGKTTAGAHPLAAAAGTPPQPATDFTDNNSSEILLVTQQGTGFAVHAISAGDAAVFAENSTSTGTGLKGLASSTSGATIGILGTAASSGGIAGVFDNTGGGKILSLRNNGNEVTGVDQSGNLTTTGVAQAAVFSGSGGGLFNVPNSATTATASSNPNTIVLRDNGGGISASQVTANFIAGNGAGLFGIPNSATTATASNNPNTIVLRDNGGGISVNQVTAGFILGNGAGLFNIPNSATTATASNNPNTIVARDNNGGIAASQMTANFFLGNGGGLFNIPNAATTAASANTPGAIVARDASGNFAAGAVQANSMSLIGGSLLNLGLTDFSGGTTTEPVHAVLSANTPVSCVAGKELLIKTDATPGQQLFICNANGNGWLLVGDGAANGVTSVAAGDGSVTVGGSVSAPTIEVANGGITGAKLAPNAVTAVNIADGSLSPTKISGTAATLGANTFSGTQTMNGLSVNGPVSIQGGANSSISATSLIASNVTGNLSATNSNGTAVMVQGGTPTNAAIVANSSFQAINSFSANSFALFASSGSTGVHADGTLTGLEAQTGNGVAVSATAGMNQGAGGTAGLFVNMTTGKILSGRSGSGSTEVFNVDTTGNLLSSGALSTQYPNSSTGTILNGLVKLTSNGLAVNSSAGDTSGAIGIAMSGAGTSGNAQIAYAGRAVCQFDSTSGPTAGDYAGISLSQAGLCRDLGQSPSPGSGQVIGRILATPPGMVLPSRAGQVLLFGTEDRGGTITTINTGQGLIGGPITSSGFISIANGGVTNAMLQNNSVTVTPGAGLSGGGAVALGGLVTLNNTGALSFNGRTGNVLPAPGDYSFSQMAGVASSAQLPATIVYNNQSNTFTTDQTINGALNTNSLTTNALAATSLSLSSLAASGNATSTLAVATVADAAPAGNVGAFTASSQNNAAGVFSSSGPAILTAGTPTHNVLTVGASGMTVNGTASATAFSGDGSALANVNASSIGGVAAASVATTSALSAETNSRQSADTTLQNNINGEASTRQSADTQLQNNINSVNAASAKLAASNTFTAGIQDFSGSGATLPVRALPIAQTPTSCVASKELLVKTDATAGQQLFICGTDGASWNLVGDGAAGGVTSFNGRNGGVTPSSGDYSFSQISGGLSASQLPALTGDVTEAAGTGVTTLAATGVAAGTYTKVAVDAKGRATSGAQAGFTDLGGSLATSQLPALTGDVTEAAGTGFTLLASTGITAGTYTKVTVDAKGRATTGAQAAFSDLAGSATPSQLPVNTVYNNQVNTFSASQAVNGNLSATFFMGNGGGLTNVNAATLNNLASSSFAQLSGNNSFTGNVSAPSFSGNGSAVTNVNAATVDGFQMLKVTGSITPASVAVSSCTEQSFTVTGINSTDTLLTVGPPSGHSPGTNIAIGGWRISAANTVNIQFCNVGRNNSSAPTAGTYTFALMR